MADFKIPTVGKAFPVFCQRIIPLTFDNSLSYLEFLGHMNAKLNEVICALNEEGVAIQELAQLVDSTLDSFKAEIQELINANKEEIMQAIDDLRTDLQGEITDLQDDVLIIKDELRLVSSQITDIIRTKGNISIFPEIEGSVDYTLSLTSANCDVYYRSPGSDIWHESATDTDLISWAAGETSESIGDKEFLFMFHGPEGYPEEQFTFPSGSALSMTAAEAEGNAVKLYSRETIPGEDFNSGLVLYADAEITSSSGTSTAALTTTESIPNINCLYLSNSFALAQLDPVTYTLSLTVPEIFGQLYNQETGNNVFPRVKINNTLAYDSAGRLGAVSALPADLPDNLVYLSDPTSQSADAYSLIYDTPVSILSNFANGTSASTWTKYTGTLRSFLQDYNPWAYTPAGRTCFIFYEAVTFPAGFTISCSDDAVSTGNTSGSTVSTALGAGYKSTIPTINDMSGFTLDGYESIGFMVYGDGKAAAISLTTSTDKGQYAALKGTGALMGLLKTTLENGYNPSNSLTIRIPSTTYKLLDENENEITLAIKHDDTLHQPAGVLGVANSLVTMVHDTAYELENKQDIIDSSHKLDADLVDDSTSTNKFATAAQLSQIATNTSAIAGKQDTIDSSHMLDADLVDDSTSTNKFATQAQLDQIALNETNISVNRAELVELVDGGAKNLGVPNSPDVVEGITVTVNSDGSFTFACTNVESNKIIRVANITSHGSNTYMLSGCSGGSSTTYMLGLYNPSASAVTYQYSDAVEQTRDISGYSLRVRIIAGYRGTFTISPMICTKSAWDISQAYVPYAMSAAEVTAWINAHST